MPNYPELFSLDNLTSSLNSFSKENVPELSVQVSFDSEYFFSGEKMLTLTQGLRPHEGFDLSSENKFKNRKNYFFSPFDFLFATGFSIEAAKEFKPRALSGQKIATIENLINESFGTKLPWGLDLKKYNITGASIINDAWNDVSVFFQTKKRYFHLYWTTSA